MRTNYASYINYAYMSVAIFLSMGFKNLLLSVGILLVNNEDKIWNFINMKFRKYEPDDIFLLARIGIRWIGYIIILINLKNKALFYCVVFFS